MRVHSLMVSEKPMPRSHRFLWKWRRRQRRTTICTNNIWKNENPSHLFYPVFTLTFSSTSNALGHNILMPNKCTQYTHSIEIYNFVNEKRVHRIHLCNLIGLSRVLTQIIYQQKIYHYEAHSLAHSLAAYNARHTFKSVKIDGNNEWQKRCHPEIREQANERRIWRHESEMETI